MASETPKRITVKTSDNEHFELDMPVAMEFGTLKSFLNETTDTVLDTIVPLHNVASETLPKIITYCKNHVEFRAKSTPKDEVEAFDANFVKGVDNEEIKVVIHAVNYLNIPELLDLLNQSVAERIKNKSVEYVRKFFNIVGDFTPEEEANLRKDSEWAFEDVEED